MPTGMSFSHFSFSIITFSGLCPLSFLQHMACLWVPFRPPILILWEVFISVFSVFAWMYSNGADGKTLLSQQETIAHGNYACCLPFHFPSAPMKWSFQKPYEFFLRLLHNSVYSAMSFQSISLFAWAFGSFSLQIIWWLFYLQFLSRCRRSPASKWVAQDSVRLGWYFYHELQNESGNVLIVSVSLFCWFVVWGELLVCLFPFGGKGC